MQNGRCPYVYVVDTVRLLVPLMACKKEGKTSWVSFFQWLCSCGLG